VVPLRTQNLAGVDGYGYRERDGNGDDVWETRWSGVSSMVWLRPPFIGQRREGSRVASMGSG
jgi:hypothetical protein